MGKAAFFVLTVCCLVASGWAFAHNGYRLHRGGTVRLVFGVAAQDVELQAAASQMLEAKVAAGSYDSINLRAFHNLVIARADERSYCLQVESGNRARHLAGPGGTPQPGPC